MHIRTEGKKRNKFATLVYVVVFMSAMLEVGCDNADLKVKNDSMDIEVLACAINENKKCNFGILHAGSLEITREHKKCMPAAQEKVCR